MLPELEPVRAALKTSTVTPWWPFATADLSTVGCVQYPEGGMGVHFLNPGLFGPIPDPMAPQLPGV